MNKPILTYILTVVLLTALIGGITSNFLVILILILLYTFLFFTFKEISGPIVKNLEKKEPIVSLIVISLLIFFAKISGAKW